LIWSGLDWFCLVWFGFLGSGLVSLVWSGLVSLVPGLVSVSLLCSVTLLLSKNWSFLFLLLPLKNPPPEKNKERKEKKRSVAVVVVVVVDGVFVFVRKLQRLH